MEKHEIQITTDFIKLDQFLKFSGLAESGGHSKEIIAEGIVKVNAQTCTQRGKKLHKGDVVEVEQYQLVVK